MSDRKNPAAVELGRLGGKKGGKARAERMSAEERSASASKAAKARLSGMTAKARRELALKAIAARWAKREVSVDPEPASVRQAKAEIRRNKREKPAGVHPMVKER